MNRREVANEGEPGPQRQRRPEPVFGRLAREFARRHRLRIEAHARQAVASTLRSIHMNISVYTVCGQA